MIEDILPHHWPQMQLHLGGLTESCTQAMIQIVRVLQISLCVEGKQKRESKTSLVDISKEPHRNMKYENGKRFILINVLHCESVTVAWCVGMHVPTVCLRQVFALVDSAAATFITAWENVMS